VLEFLALAALAVVVLSAVVRPRGWSEAVFAVPAAALVLLIGAVSTGHARDETMRIAPVVGFLAAVLVVSVMCAEEGVFDAVGASLARWAGGGTRSGDGASGSRLLLAVFGAAAVTTAVLSLDTTVVLLTPVVLVSAHRAGLRARPHLYACAHLSNSGSLLLPVSNLTNLLALAVLPLSFTRFAALMALPWLVAVAVEYLVFRLWFRRALATEAPVGAEPASREWPRFALAVLALTLVGFVVASLVGIGPVWVATGGAVALAGKRLARAETSARNVVTAAAPGFCLFVVALALVVRAASDHGLSRLAGDLLPSGSGLPALLATATVAAVAANLLNNLPATLVLLPLASPSGVGPVLAVLIGVNVGPNLTYAGSLATLLWRRVLAGVEGVPSLGEFTALGVLTVPAILVASTCALWVSLRVIGVS
jgi:arsenical pump membrane protein